MSGKKPDLYEQERLGIQLSAERDKALIELGKLTKTKIAAGLVTDKQLTSASRLADKWEQALERWRNSAGVDPSDPNEESVTPEAEPIANGSLSLQQRFPQLIRLTAWRGKAWLAVKPGLFAALLSIIVMLALSQAISLVANKALESAVTGAKQTAAANIRERVGEVLPAVNGGSSRLPSFVPVDAIEDFVRGKLPDLSHWQERLPESWQTASLPTLFDASKIALLLHSVPAEFTLGTSATGPFRAVTDESLASGGVTVQLGLYALLLVPLFALALGGYFAAWRMKLKSLREAAVLALIVGIGYSLFLATLALTSDMSAHSSLPRGIVGVEASFRFDPARALLHGFALGALGSLAGCMLRIGVRAAAKELRSRVPYGRPVGMAALAVVAGIGAALLYAGIVLGAKGLLSPIWLAALPQLAIGLWNVAQGNSLQLTDLAANGGSSISVSLFGGISGNGAAQAYGAEWNPYIAAFAVVPAILLVLAGVWLRGARGAAAESNGKALVFGIAYAAFMSLTVSLTEVSAAAYAQIGSRSIGSFALQAGFSLAGTFLVCFIAAYLLSLCGMRIRQHLLDS